jgi:hypothetical protein
MFLLPPLCSRRRIALSWPGLGARRSSVLLLAADNLNGRLDMDQGRRESGQ